MRLFFNVHVDSDTPNKRHRWHRQSKLSQVSGIPEGRIVYRGVGGMRTPACFREQNDKGVKGGTERAFMSTTTSRAVAIYVRVRLHFKRCLNCDAARVSRHVPNAWLHCSVCLQYIAGCEMPTIFRIQVSAVSKGASLSHLSQFPGEEEVRLEHFA